MLRRLSWPPIAAICCFLAAVALAIWLPEALGLALAFSVGSVTFAVLSLRDVATRDLEP